MNSNSIWHRAGSVLKRCHLRGRFDQDPAASSSKQAVGRPPRGSKAKKSGGPRSPPPSAPQMPMPDRRVSDLGLASGGCGSEWAHDGGSDGVCPSHGAETAGDGGGEEAPRARERHVLHRGLSDGGIPTPASVATATPATALQTTTAAAAAAAAAGRGEDVALREGGLVWGGSVVVEESALVAWSAVHGAFADVLRGMSPPASTLLPGSEGSPSTDLDDV